MKYLDARQYFVRIDLRRHSRRLQKYFRLRYQCTPSQASHIERALNTRCADRADLTPFFEGPDGTILPCPGDIDWLDGWVPNLLGLEAFVCARYRCDQAQARLLVDALDYFDWEPPALEGGPSGTREPPAAVIAELDTRAAGLHIARR